MQPHGMTREAFRGSFQMGRAFPGDEEQVHVCCVGDSSQAFTAIFFPGV